LAVSLPSPLVVSVRAARRFARRAVQLDRPLPAVAAVLDHHGYVQIDPINVCGRMHDLILRHRVAGYREGDLMRHLHGPDDGPPREAEARTAFEHHLPDTSVLVAFPSEAWPYLQGAMAARTRRAGPWSGRLTPRERELAKTLLAEIAARGPLGSEDFDDPRRARRVWGAAKLVKSTLQKLFFHGRLLIARRVNNRRRYDLPERVLPKAVLARPPASAEAAARWTAQLKLRQRRLALLKRDELRAVADLVQPVRIADADVPLLHCLRSDTAVWAEVGETAGPADTAASPLLLLAPLDPLVYDRRVTKALWDFDYTWEVYTPPAKRVRGYYALPVLAGTELVGHVDPRADRASGRLVIESRRTRGRHPVAPAITALAAWLGLRR
jgi:uncharacterized protein YcaQ